MSRYTEIAYPPGRFNIGIQRSVAYLLGFWFTGQVAAVKNVFGDLIRWEAKHRSNEDATRVILVGAQDCR